MNKEFKIKYDNLISEVQNEDRGIKKLKDHGMYFNIHHVVPKSLGGSNDPSNLVKLTHREHFLAHRYLYYMYKDSSDSIAKRNMTYGWLLLSNHGKHNEGEYAELKKEVSIMMSKKVGNKNPMFGIPLSKERKDNLRKANLGKRHSKDSKCEIGKSSQERWDDGSMDKRRKLTKDEEDIRRDKISKSQLGVGFTKEHKQNISKTKLGNKNPMFGRKWFNNGIKDKMLDPKKPIPSGYVLGRVKKKKEKIIT